MDTPRADHEHIARPLDWRILPTDPSFRRQHAVESLHSTMLAGKRFVSNIHFHHKHIVGFEDPKTQAFAKAIWYHADNVFKETVKFFKTDIEAGRISPGIWRGWDVVTELRRAENALTELQTTTSAFIQDASNASSTKHILSISNGDKVPTATPKEILLSIYWDQCMKDHKRMEYTPKETLGEFDTQPSLQQLLTYRIAAFASDTPQDPPIPPEFLSSIAKTASDGIPAMVFCSQKRGNVLDYGRQYVTASAPKWGTSLVYQALVRDARRQYMDSHLFRVLNAVSRLREIEADLLPAEEAKFFPVDFTARPRMPRVRVHRDQLTGPETRHAKANSRRGAIERMRQEPSFLNHIHQQGHAYAGNQISLMVSCCYVCQGIYGYQNPHNSIGDIVMNRETQVGKAFDNKCAEAKKSALDHELGWC